MRCLDALAAAGWEWDEIGRPELKPVMERFRELLRCAGLSAAQEIDRLMFDRAGSKRPIFDDLLLMGFDGRHWPIWNVLRAAIRSSCRASVCLSEPRANAPEADILWVNSWEDNFGEAEMTVDTTSDSPFATLAAAIETGGNAPAGQKPSFLVGSDTQEEAMAVVTMAIHWLGQPECESVAIVCPGAGSLAREISLLLSRYDIPYHDGIGYPEPPSRGDTAWKHWLDLQLNYDLESLLAFLHVNPQAADCTGKSAKELRREIIKTSDELLSHDVAAAAEAIQQARAPLFQRLPEKAAISDFISAMESIVRPIPGVGSSDKIELIREHAGLCLEGLDEPVGRECFIRWAEALTAQQRRVAADSGKHPYARVRLMTYAKSEGQTWSHAILCGLNRSLWPPDEQSMPFLAEETIESLNRRAIAVGRHGEGHNVADAKHGCIIGPRDRSAFAFRQFLNAIEATTRELCFAASFSDDSDPSLMSAPSDYLLMAHHAAFGAPLDQNRMSEFRSRTSHWLSGIHAPAAEVSVEERSEVEQTQKARDERTDPAKPFGIYECALAEPPSNPPVLSSTDWQNAMAVPDLVWIQRYLKAEPPPELPNQADWRKTIGTWVHTWLGRAFSCGKETGKEVCGRIRLKAMPGRDELLGALRAAAETTLSWARNISAATGRQLPDWWERTHSEAASSAEHLADMVLDFAREEWPLCAAECNIPNDAPVRIPGVGELPLRGRMDLLLAKSAAGPFLVLDFKTGSVANPTPASFSRGENLQILLYGLSLLGLCEDIAMALASAEEQRVKCSFLSDDLADPSVLRLLERIVIMHRTGRFGCAYEIRSRHGQSGTYPLATLRVPRHIVEAKKQLFEQRHPSSAGKGLRRKTGDSK